VLLTALLAISISMFSFGFSKTFFSLLVRFACYIAVVTVDSNILTSRVICGTFNGGNGIVKSLVMDITDTTNLPRAYGYMPLPFMIGTMIG
jgi:hypothetical protein